MNLFIIFIALLACNKLLEILNNKLENNNKTEWFKYAFLSRKHLVGLSISYFQDWCVCFLKRLGYSNFKIVPVCKNENYKDIICLKENKTTYVSCILTKEIDEKQDDYFIVGRPELQKFIGTMEHDNIFDGILITTGDFSSDALAYVDSLPEKFSIKLFDGITLTQTHRTLREKEVALLIQQENNC